MLLEKGGSMKFLKQKMKEKKMSQIELAVKLGVSDSSVSKWLRWGVKVPHKYHEKICKELGCKLGELND